MKAPSPTAAWSQGGGSKASAGRGRQHRAALAAAERAERRPWANGEMRVEVEGRASREDAGAASIVLDEERQGFPLLPTL